MSSEWGARAERARHTQLNRLPTAWTVAQIDCLDRGMPDQLTVLSSWTGPESLVLRPVFRRGREIDVQGQPEPLARLAVGGQRQPRALGRRRDALGRVDPRHVVVVVGRGADQHGLLRRHELQREAALPYDMAAVEQFGGEAGV